MPFLTLPCPSLDAASRLLLLRLEMTDGRTSWFYEEDEPEQTFEELRQEMMAQYFSEESEQARSYQQVAVFGKLGTELKKMAKFAEAVTPPMREAVSAYVKYFVDPSISPEAKSAFESIVAGETAEEYQQRKENQGKAPKHWQKFSHNPHQRKGKRRRK